MEYNINRIVGCRLTAVLREAHHCAMLQFKIGGKLFMFVKC